MTTVRATAPCCGSVEVPASTVAVAHNGKSSTYAVTCPKCHDPFVKPASLDILTIFRKAGIREWAIPARDPELDDYARKDPRAMDRADLAAALTILAADVDLIAILERHQRWAP